ncbi:hypothetical protein GUITHDRAFT_140918 [Guillardia theta CCMP2712]|uniref:Pentacotripeptide-repeat region of PRORP domain-containing protein n=1 Tax=Guillardia theta (strain CCMP2712) TaxID=905079 RepID=L1J3T5_GUITC|nr:hypothetical protein GUITHDRAFT_140918 [Guillardia theta CCMP2712]EKX42755.1 hypothetical protein GUITHDRAFT_140918 [Guillardia theta CCMP2712]|eukprot:XP_005829735.1 hypothetical protein GUITHDRAFT_140918 [Guillardia theta CCMP2712]
MNCARRVLPWMLRGAGCFPLPLTASASLQHSLPSTYSLPRRSKVRAKEREASESSFRVTVQALGRFCGRKGWRLKRITARTGALIVFQQVQEDNGNDWQGHVLDVTIKAESLDSVHEAQQLFQQEVILDSIRDTILAKLKSFKPAQIETLSEILRRECFLHQSPLIESDYNTAMNMMVAMKMFDSARLWLEYILYHERDVLMDGLPFKTLINCAVKSGRLEPLLQYQAVMEKHNTLPAEVAEMLENTIPNSRFDMLMELYAFKAKHGLDCTSLKLKILNSKVILVTPHRDYFMRRDVLELILATAISAGYARAILPVWEIYLSVIAGTKTESSPPSVEGQGEGEAEEITAMWEQYGAYGFKPSHSCREVYFISLMSAGNAQHALLFVSEMDRQLLLPSFDAIRKASINAFRLKAAETFMLSNPCSVLQDIEASEDAALALRTPCSIATWMLSAGRRDFNHTLMMFSTFYPLFLEKYRKNLYEPLLMQRLVYLNNALLEMAMLHSQFATADQVFKAMKEDGVVPDADTLASMALILIKQNDLEGAEGMLSQWKVKSLAQGLSVPILPSS